MAQILISHGHPPETVGGYAVCTMEAFAESIMHLENLKGRRDMVETSIASQGDSKSIEGYMKSIPTSKNHEQDGADDSEELLRHFQSMSKGAE